MRQLHPMIGRFLQRDPLRHRDGANLYGYVASNPILYVDSAGLQTTKPTKFHTYVRVVCSPVHAFRGVLAAAGFFHCAVVVTCGNETRVLEDLGPGAQTSPTDYDSRKGQMKFIQPASQFWPKPDDRVYSVATDGAGPNEDAAGCGCELFTCLLSAFQNAKFTEYSGTGPNSNTFAHHLLGKCNLKLKGNWHEVFRDIGVFANDDDQPLGAVGWNDPDPGYWPNWKYDFGSCCQ
jgi:hypothetical protein